MAPRHARRTIIYQLVVRHFGNENLTRARDGRIDENGVGKFADLNEAAAAMLVDLGVTHVWLTGVLRQATLTDWSSLGDGMGPDPAAIVKGRAGSFYAIRDYFDVCPDYALDPSRRVEEFEQLVARLHAAGLRVLLDLVPNHVARSHASVVRPDLEFGLGDDQTRFFSPQNHFFYLVDPPGQSLRLRPPPSWRPAGVTFEASFAREDGGPGRVPRATGNNVTSPAPSADDWYETVKLNYGHNFADPASSSYDPRPPVWDRIDAILAHWQGKGVDGFRCDFAHYVPDAAWSWLLARARERDEQALLIAEAYENLDGLLRAGFDAVYHDAAYDLLKEIYQGRRGLDDLDRLLAGLGDEQRRRYVHYLENHDERRVASPLVTDGGPDSSGFGSAWACRQLAPVLYLCSNGPLIFYNGQEVGEDGSGHEGFGGDDGKTSIFDYWGLPSLAALSSGKAWDGRGLSAEQAALRAYYRDLLALCHDRSARADGYRSLRRDNPHAPYLFAFARFAPGDRRLLVVAANFQPGSALQTSLRLPPALLQAAGIHGPAALTRLLDERGAASDALGLFSPETLARDGFPVRLPDQTAHVFALASPAT